MDVRKEVPSIGVAFVLLSEARLPKAKDVIKAFATYATGQQRLRTRAGTSSQPPGEEILEFEVSPDAPAFVLLVPFPVPDGEADERARFSISALGTGWSLPPHRAHLVVTLPAAGGGSLIGRLSSFTTLLAAVTEASRAVGVYWGAAGATHDPEFVRSVAREPGLVSRIMLWNGVSMAREADGRLSLLSLGMGQLQLPDLLLVAPQHLGNEALATLCDLLAYVADRGRPIPEGDTVGRTAEERFVVEYVPSPADPTTKVWRVELA